MRILLLLLSLSLLFFLWACGGQDTSVTAAAGHATPKPGVVSLADNMPQDSLCFPAVFEAAFKEGTRVTQGLENYRLITQNLGDLNSPTGKIVAGDPVVLPGGSAFAQQLPIGKFPVQLALAKTTDDKRVGFARVLFSPARVAHWQLALLPGQKPLALRDSAFYCYGVDAGMGVFIDSSASQHFAWHDRATWDKVFLTQTDQADYQGYLYNFGKYNLATFSTGFGDGCYATYIGFDAKGKVCRLLTDFGLITW